MLPHFIGEKAEAKRNTIICLLSYPHTLSGTLKDAATATRTTY